MPIVMGPNNYGKSEVRLVKVTRGAERHEIRDVTVDVALAGDLDAAHVEGDNTDVIATDTMRNTVYALAREDPVESLESFGLALGRHFLASPLTQRAQITLTEFPWERIQVGGRAHEHSFTRGAGRRTATVTATADDAQVEAGIDDLWVLKTTNSGWEGFARDQYTTLPETNDRILATVVTATWAYESTDVDFERAWAGVRDSILATFTDHYSPSVQNTLYRMGEAVLDDFPEVARIHFSMPNKHHLRYDLDRFGLDNPGEIFEATYAPYGLIEGTVERTREPAESGASTAAARGGGQ